MQARLLFNVKFFLSTLTDVRHLDIMFVSLVDEIGHGYTDSDMPGLTSGSDDYDYLDIEDLWPEITAK